MGILAEVEESEGGEKKENDYRGVVQRRRGR